MGTKAPYHLQEMQALSRRGMTELVLFLLISTAFFFCRQTDLLAPLAESARQILGCPPPAALITMAVAGYVASASVLLLNRILTGARPLFKWSNLFFRTIFFLFYAFAAALLSHFIGVFVAGLVLFALEQLNIWTYCVKTQPTGKALPSKS
jgi:hypothetical protein